MELTPGLHSQSIINLSSHVHHRAIQIRHNQSLESMYMASIYFWNVALITFLLSFIVGVTSPESTVNSKGRIVYFCTLWALEIAFLLAFSKPFFIISLTFGQLIASLIVLAEDPFFLRISTTSSLSSSGVLVLRQRRTVRYLRLSPITTAMETIGRAAVISFSINTGGMFSPPAVIISSLSLPVM